VSCLNVTKYSVRIYPGKSGLPQTDYVNDLRIYVSCGKSQHLPTGPYLFLFPCSQTNASAVP
jgi:hypothetical protein